MKRNKPSPKVKGRIEISNDRHGVFIGGDPEGLLSLAKLLKWLGKMDPEECAGMPDDERCHVHLFPGPHGALTEWSRNTEVCRLDAKGSGEVPSGPFRGGKSKAKQS